MSRGEELEDVAAGAAAEVEDVQGGWGCARGCEEEGGDEGEGMGGDVGVVEELEDVVVMVVGGGPEVVGGGGGEVDYAGGIGGGGCGGVHGGSGRCGRGWHSERACVYIDVHILLYSYTPSLL